MGNRLASVGHLVYAPDGHRRWASKSGISLFEVYAASVDVIIELIGWCFGKGGRVDELSLGVMAEYNLDRPMKDTAPLMDAFLMGASKVCGSRVVQELDIQVDVVGELDVLFSKHSDEEKLHSALKKVNGHEGKKVHVLAPYNGNKELARALTRCAETGQQPTFEGLAKFWRIPKVDLYLRTGQAKGFVRIPQYLPGIEKARLFGTPTYPQDFTKKEFDRIIRDFLSLEDSYEKTSRK
ncbi:MAG: undecaprenyl diphosphate synthase family protein [Candidatus Aenigmatarchaeota archaeon]|nr:MAG: undecaprenyl diphosphate synthase family protein [Candidatus Aenigmarchaeota archaeon]